MNLWARLRALPRELRIVLVLAAVLHGVGLWWGLPASDGWDNDGIAPRDILPGLASTFTPGDFYTYPPVHLALLGLLTLPVTAIAVVRAGTHVPDVIHEILSPGYMTAFALTARIVALLMSLGIAVALAKIADEIGPKIRYKGAFTAAVASAGMSFTYYAHVSNLDLPALFWGSLAGLALVRALGRAEPRRLRHVAIFGALAMGTKDQAYALFALSVPALAVAWLVTERKEPVDRRREIAREALLSFVIAVVLLLVVDGAVFNPSGFRARLAFLRGPASQDFSTYSNDLAGRLAIVRDVLRQLPRNYPTIFAAPIAVGIVLSLGERATRLAALVPLAFAVSFTVAFDFAARRTEDRFTLPQYLFVSVYAGIALSWFYERAPRPLAIGVCSAFLAAAVWQAVRVDLTLLYEPRYAAEAYLREHSRAGDVIEVHGINVYLPRFPAGARVIRVGSTPPSKRGPLPGVEEIQAPLMGIEQRQPRFVAVSKCYVWRYLVSDTRPAAGRMYPASQQREADDADATTFFKGLFGGALRYRVAFESVIPDTAWFESIEIHASTNCRMTVFERL